MKNVSFILWKSLNRLFGQRRTLVCVCVCVCVCVPSLIPLIFICHTSLGARKQWYPRHHPYPIKGSWGEK